MKKVTKLSGILLGKILFESSNIKKFSGDESKILILTQFENILYEYSNAGEKDFLRIAVIKSLKFSLPEIFDLLKSNNYELLLSYSRTFVRLLQDEIPEIRQKMGNFLSKLLGKYMCKNEEFTYNFNTVLEKYLCFLMDLFTSNPTVNDKKENLYKLIDYLLNFVFESEYFRFKKTNFFEKRIFSFDKPNKFIDDVLLKSFAFSHLKTIEKFLQKKENAKILKEEVKQHIEKFVFDKKFSFLVYFSIICVF